jgi:hypothetical protein
MYLCQSYVMIKSPGRSAILATLKMEVIRSSETSVNTRPTQRHIPEDDILHIAVSLLAHS